jgi:ElaB/YqjD/DUF883 family membrane-anchored ribosome-binding protein
MGTANSGRQSNIPVSARGGVMAEPVLDNPGPVDDFAQAPGSGPDAEAGPARMRAGRPSRQLLRQCRARWEEMRERIRRPVEEAGRGLARELNRDADYVKNRARRCHESRPLQALGVVAAAGFALGLTLGLWRRQ